MALANFSFGQKTKTEVIPVSGNCGMCETKIEKAARQAGASTAEWNSETKKLTIKYNSSTTNAAKIQKSIAAAGYDTRDVKAADADYNKLHGCCQYDRTSEEKADACCSEKCEIKDGKCTDMAGCKDKGCCSADGVCKAGESCSHAEGHDKKAGCCKKQ
ncbi:MAG: heavy-metal-associated domain-containing protein [Chitinophagaceae bacterium]|nr:heavy-metal-associated domain-containing protein [Chitinophagaceae bacterium]